MEKELVTIGTVVKLKEGSKKIMVIGYYPTAVGDMSNQTFDYSGCLFPEGVINSKNLLLFNHDQIEEVYHNGLSDQEALEFIEKIKNI